jgi:hypothetical protein
MIRAVSRRAAFLVDPEGHSFPIEERLIIGRAREGDVLIQSGRVARHHVALLRMPSGEVEAEDLATTNGTRLNGVALRHRVLAHGDVLELDELRYTFSISPDVPAPVDPAIALLVKAVDDEGALQVATDLLLEQGHPLGAQLASGARVPMSAVLERAVEGRTLELEWRRGFVRAARVRAQPFHQARDLLFELLRSEVGRFLQSLTLPEFHERYGLPGASMPALRVLRFGPFFTTEESDRCVQALSTAHFSSAPLLEKPEVLSYRRAWLEFGGDQRRELEQGRQETFPTCLVRWEPGGWIVQRVRPSQALNFNGRNRFAATLAPGDEVSSGGTSFVFRAS